MGNYYFLTIVDLSDFNNPKVILASTYSNNFDLADTSISTIFKVYWRNENKFSLIDIKGNELTNKVDLIYFDTRKENEQIVYVANLAYLNENNEFEYDNIYFDVNGKTIEKMPSQQLIKQYQKKEIIDIISRNPKGIL